MKKHTFQQTRERKKQEQDVGKKTFLHPGGMIFFFVSFQPVELPWAARLREALLQQLAAPGAAGSSVSAASSLGWKSRNPLPEAF